MGPFLITGLDFSKVQELCLQWAKLEPHLKSQLTQPNQVVSIHEGCRIADINPEKCSELKIYVIF